MEDKKQPIVIKKIVQGHGAHGGSWKVAFADFATAMMAFFMVLWLVGQTDAQKRGGIAEYFQNPSMVKGRSEAPTGSMGPGGASTSLIQMGGTMELQRQLPVHIEKVKDEEVKKKKITKIELLEDAKRLDVLLEDLKETIAKSKALQQFKDQLKIDITPEGLRIQIVDKKGRPMFASGSGELQSYAVEIIHELAGVINKVPNRLSVSGHTDATPFSAKGGTYTNWELSTDRANAARRTLIGGKIPPKKFAKVVGLASTQPYDTKNPTSPINRRISIIVLNRETSEYAPDEKPRTPSIQKKATGSQQMDDIRSKLPKKDEADTKIERIKTPTSGSTPATPGISGLKGVKPEKRVTRKNNGNNKPKRSITIRSRSEVGKQAPLINLPPIIDPSLLPQPNRQNQ